MTYLGFILVFLCLPVAVLALTVRPTRLQWIGIASLLGITLAWAIPWDNYLAATGVWSYDPRLLLGVWIGWAPLEEYLFILLMPVLYGLWTCALLKWIRPGSRRADLLAALAVAAALICLAASRAAPPPTGSRPLTYLLLLAGWSAPVILGQVALGWKILSGRAAVWVLGSLVPALVLTVGDSIALQGGIWQINPARMVNVFLPGQVPLEEGLFFLLTGLMIVQGLLLFTSPELRARFLRRPAHPRAPSDRVS